MSGPGVHGGERTAPGRPVRELQWVDVVNRTRRRRPRLFITTLTLLRAMAALATGRVASPLRGEALIAIYAAFNVGATCASVGFARFGEAYGPAAVFPLAAGLGVLGWLALLAFRRRNVSGATRA